MTRTRYNESGSCKECGLLLAACFCVYLAVYCENLTEHTDTLRGQNVEFHCVRAGGTYSDRWALKG
jgi:hypothetical protein